MMKKINLKSLLLGIILGAVALAVWSALETPSMAQLFQRKAIVAPSQIEIVSVETMLPTAVQPTIQPTVSADCPCSAAVTPAKTCCNCNCVDSCKCGSNCKCADSCKCGSNCKCADSCKCGNKCKCVDSCKCVSSGKVEFPGASDQWIRGFDRQWIADEKERHEIKPHADNSPMVTITDSQKEGHTYGNYTAADLLLWETETERLVVEGSLIFHNGDLLKSTNGVSCDMCHPDGEGTHAETYPKYQVQLGRAALLRDMANWCLTHPCRAEPMSGDDPRMRALEAYMQAQRTGKPMKYGKH